MVSQQKVEQLLREQFGKPRADSTSGNAAAGNPDTAAELVDALDNLLLARAVNEHREALARLNKLKLALDQKANIPPVK